MQEFFEIYLPKPNLIVAYWVIVLISIFIDLVAGVWKSKSLNFLITSDGLKRTVNKVVLYLTAMSFACMMDMAIYGIELTTVPYISSVMVLFLLIVEGKSVLERAQDKDRRKINQTVKDLITLIENKEDILKGVNKVLQDNLKDEQLTQTENNETE